jgi:hypothetical protein
MKRPTTLTDLCWVICFSVVMSSCVNASPEPALLTITTDQHETIELSLDDLTVTPIIVYDTTTIWTNGTQKFHGVSLKKTLEKNNVTKGTIFATAVNDYAVEIPLSEITDDWPIIAYKLNNQRLNLRNKGPLWIVYPYDSHYDFRSEVVYSRSIWQLDRIKVK